MNQEAHDALLGSIEKWKRIVDGTGEDRGTENCALCRLYHYKHCYECPVQLATGKIFCTGSPYGEWERHHEDDHCNETGICSVVHGCKFCQELAEAELKFLESLLSSMILVT